METFHTTFMSSVSGSIGSCGCDGGRVKEGDTHCVVRALEDEVKR